MRRVIVIIATAALVAFVSSCGYSFKSGKVREGLQTVAVPYFENRTTEPGIEIDLTEDIVEALIADRTLRITEENEADALVVGTIRRYRFGEAFFGADRQAEEYRVDIQVEVTLVDRVGGEAIVGPKMINGTGSYFLDEGAGAEEDARIQATKMIVEGILNLVIEEW